MTEQSEAEQWKRQYFDQLQELETREKQWRQSDELLRKTISRLTVAADGQDEGLDRQLVELRNAIRDRADNVQLQAAIDGMSNALIRLDWKPNTSATQRLPDKAAGGFLQRLFGGRKNRSQATANERVTAATQQAPQQAASVATVREILIRLLERLSLPDDLVERVEAVRNQIEVANEQGAWDAVVEQIADLVQAIRTQTQEERQGIENFLLELSGRLQEVNHQLAGSEQYYDDSFAAGRQLDSAVKQGIGGIASGMREATDLNQMKRLAQNHIDVVLTHMERHRAAEQQRYDKAKADMSAMNDRLRELEGETDSLRTRLRHERSQAQTDALTGIPNRLAYEQRLEQEVARWKRFSTPLVLLIWDIDRFKDVNDTFGHQAGDKVLRTIARALEGSIRETDFIARYGGEEFVHLMTGTALDECLVVADKLRAMIESTGFHFRDKAVVVTASCGLAQLRDGDSTESWFERADQALYQAKQAGRNRCDAAS
ncbi:MAG: diguanylate cyclase [Thiogranum sp.]|jgi:diguanylate cyclase|nr:diguanylate cyclase [Thiogranum sp.]